MKYLHHPKLLVGDAHYAHIALGGKVIFGAVDVHFSVFAAAAMAHVNAELKHLKAVCQHFFAKSAGVFAVLFGVGREVEEYKYPHDAICV